MNEQNENFLNALFRAINEEKSSQFAQCAAQTFALYKSLVNSGFTKEQAFELVKIVLSNSIKQK